MTLNDRINHDLTERYNGLELSGAKSLSRLIKVSTKGLPQHFVGDRAAKTVLVMLNPGQDVDGANRDFRELTNDYNRSSAESFVADYVAAKTNFGELDKGRADHFDIKQAAFLKSWKGTAVKLPVGFPDDKKTFLTAKRNVLMQKLQLELIPYCSREFKFKNKDLSPIFPFVETMLEEIFTKKRAVVVFCAGIFERVFKAYNKHAGEEVFSMGDPAISDPLKQGGKLCGKCVPIEICFSGRRQRAIIARTFASQALSRAYGLMEKYGEFCFRVFLKYGP